MLQKKVRLINSLIKNSAKNLLDIGAGTGDFLIEAKKKNWNVEGIEPNSKAQNLAQTKGLKLHKEVEELSGKKFSVISMWHVLEHVPNLEEQIKTLHTILEEDGFVIIAVPNFKSYDAIYYKEHWAAYDVPRHLWHFSQTGIERLFLAHKFKLIDTLPLPFDAYYVSLLSEKYKNGKSNLFKAFQVGLKSNTKAKTTSEYSSLIYVFKKLKN
jgi:2-polyprenyl-3-methyl-5-hydroxy-6-metoxy-1,4-benzoquinol methylase